MQQFSLRLSWVQKQNKLFNNLELTILLLFTLILTYWLLIQVCVCFFCKLNPPNPQVKLCNLHTETPVYALVLLLTLKAKHFHIRMTFYTLNALVTFIKCSYLSLYSILLIQDAETFG